MDRFSIGLVVGDVVVCAHWGPVPDDQPDLRSRYQVVGFANGRVRIQPAGSILELAVLPEFLLRVTPAAAAA